MFACRSPLQRFLITGLAVLLLIVAAGPASAQETETETYESEFFPFTLTYDSEIWGSRSTSRFNNNEQVQLVAGATVFFLQAFEAAGNDAEDCIASAIESVEGIDSVDNVEAAEDLPMPDGPRRAEETLLVYDYIQSGRENPLSMAQYIGCVEMDGGDSILLVGIETRAGIYEEELEIIDGILAGLEIDD